jgi:hypothetical protein
MAVVKINFVKKGAGERSGAKANIKYIQYRRGRDGAKIKRTLFGVGGEMERYEAYELINQAAEGSTFFRVKISPDPKKEDTGRDLLMREITARTLDIEESIGRPIAWVAAIHDDHTQIRHIHVLAVTTARLLPAKAMIQAATTACLEQRRALDLAAEHQREPEREEEDRSWERERSK